MTNLEQRIFDLGQRLQLIHVATLDERGLPWVRPVVGRLDEQLTLRFATHLNSRKVGHIAAQRGVHATLGATDPRSERWLQIDGEAEVSTSAEEREAFWFDGLKAHVSSVDSPLYSVVVIRPKRIELRTIHHPEAETWTQAT